LDLGKQAEVPVRSLILELLDFVDDVVDDLGSRAELEYIHTILKEGTSADRQLRIFHETNGDLHAVVDNLIQETLQGVMAPEEIPSSTTVATQSA
jgi:carboxylate-amine ligase